MKKGCFLTFLTIITVIVVSIIYIFKYHSNEAFEIVKPFIVESMMDETLSKIDEYVVTQNADSVKFYVKQYFKEFKEREDISFEEFQTFFDKLELVLHDKRLDSLDLEIIKAEFREQLGN